MAGTLKTEIYVRFSSEKHGHGVFEAPAQTIEEAAGQFTEDADSISAVKMIIDEHGRMIFAQDVTGEVLDTLRQLIDDDTFTVSPHHLVQDHFDEWEQNAERQAQEQADHERAESQMINV